MSFIKQHFEYSTWKLLSLLDENVAQLDPLNLNEFFAIEFPTNESGCPEKLDSIINVINTKINELGTDYFEGLEDVPAMAAVRDLNMVASMLVRWQISMERIPSLEHILLILAQKTREVPTDTVFTYGPRNPKGEYQRVFTNAIEEKVFIDSFVQGMKALPVCIAGLSILIDTASENPRYAAVMYEASKAFNAMVENIISVRKRISAEVFTNVLRPYFEPKIIGGEKYFAPGGAQMPICIIDFLLWGIENNDDVYIRYFKESVAYLPNAIRMKLFGMYKKSSLFKKTTSYYNGGNYLNNAFNDSVLATIEMMSAIEKFRAPHLAIAKDNMKLRPAQSVGSGGYDTAILEYLLNQTKECRKELEKMKKRTD